MPYVSSLKTPAAPQPRATTGIAGLDNVLGGGLPRGHLYLVEGTPGAGKTTLGLQFLLEGRARGEKGLYVTLSETAPELGIVARRRMAGRSTASSCSSWSAKKASSAAAEQSILLSLPRSSSARRRAT